MTNWSQMKVESFPASVCAIVAMFCAVVLAYPAPAAAQIRPVYDQGALGLAQSLKRLNTTAKALMIGAHPDDEDTALLAYLARGENARTAYLSLTRGDGGQNLIGPELGEALGVIRTEELLQARRLDGAEQFFTRAYDYGFSKTLAEAREKWDEKVILCDVVGVIRSFQPQVVISVFNGTPADGHGQHQYAGYISPLAVKAAADPAQCRGTGSVWNVKKFYVRHRGTNEPTLKINTGKYDPLLGRSYFEIAMQARSQHRSQEQGVLELKGDQFSNLDLVQSSGAKVEKESGIFDGIDVSTRRPVNEAPDLQRPEALVADLATYHPEATDAIFRAAGIRIDVLADRETAASFEKFPVAVRLFVPANGIAVKIEYVRFNFPAVKFPEPPASSSATVRRETANYEENYTLTVPEGRRFTRPFWLTEPRRGDFFATSFGGGFPITPFDEDPAFADIDLQVAGKKFTVRKHVEYRFADDIRGEVRREFNVVPKLSVGFERELLIVPTSTREAVREIAVTVTNNTDGPVSGRVRLEFPRGWTTSAADGIPFAMSRQGEKVPLRFPVRIPPGAEKGAYEIRAAAVLDDKTLSPNNKTFALTMQTISYEHIQTHRIYRPAKTDLRLMDVAAAPVRVGYIRGSGDRVAEAIRQLGLDVTDIDEQALATGDLSMFDTIVVGIRAYQVRPDLIANNQRLLDFVSGGGTLVVQYQLPPTYAQQKLTPFPTQMGPRVVDENAVITITEPSHAIFNFPNKITSEDFKGWVQERNLYNFVQMDPKYVGLLESHDTGEPENTGGLVIADIGKGKYIYCSYSLFRQLPAGVPGAYRLLANMLSVGKARR
ncbi:MAG TPA: PIG-L family deacetylase [Pyrinomonadaceae bacterium]|nr:PIG-L family deacetylase [Pyrinomonadaceae bacterium]